MNERVPHHRVVSGVLRDAQTPAIRPRSLPLPYAPTCADRKCVLGYECLSAIKAPTGRNYQVVVESKFPPRHVEAPTLPPGTY